MLITLWVFIGVEGAVVVSARACDQARRWPRDAAGGAVGPRDDILLVTLLSLGVVPRSELAEMRNPSMAGLMVRLMGSWGDRHCRRADRVGVWRLSQLDHHGRGGAFPRRHS